MESRRSSCCVMIAPLGIDIIVRCPCLAAILRSPAIGPVVHCCGMAICCWPRRCADHCCRHCCCPNHRPPRPILRLIVVGVVIASWIDVIIVIAFHPCKPTNWSSGGWGQGRSLGGNCIGIIAALPWGGRPAGRTSKTNLLSLLLLHITILMLFFHACRTATKMLTNNNCHTVYNLIVHGVTITNSQFFQQVWLDRDQNL